VPSSHFVSPPLAPVLLDFRSAAFTRALEELRRFARDPTAPILIEGESGTGKTLIARHVHAGSPRASKPFETVVLSALDDSLASSELFGHVPGAYTDARSARSGAFAMANGGTLFLDEIGKASSIVQQKLLHAIEYGEIKPLGSDRTLRVDARVIAASNLSLERLAASGTFLPDLFARLETFLVKLPPLRERRADIPLLVRHYAGAHGDRVGYPRPPEIDPELMMALQRAPWPHNLRQLQATMHRIVLEADGAPVLTLEHCRGALEYLVAHARDPQQITLGDIESALVTTGRNVSRAAELLGVDRTTLYRTRRRLEMHATSRGATLGTVAGDVAPQ
jgi:DNA-binding NtrC family response regulator